MKIRLIMNPGSRSGKGQQFWGRWEAGLRAAGIEFDGVVTRGMGHAFQLAKDARDVDVVVAVGGDGTISEVLDGVIQSGRLDLQMGVLYSGTSPDFCRYHGIPVEPDAALTALTRGVSQKVDVARIRYRRKDGSATTAHFGCGCNIGLGASVARFSNRIRKYLGDHAGTGLAVIRALVLNRPVNLELEMDGEKMSVARVNNLSILKNPYMASGLRLHLDLRPDDGKLYLVGVHGKSRWGLCCLLPGYYSGEAAVDETMLVRTCARIRVRSSTPLEIEFDGDPRGRLPADIELLPRRLDLIGAAHE